MENCMDNMEFEYETNRKTILLSMRICNKI